MKNKNCLFSERGEEGEEVEIIKINRNTKRGKKSLT